MVCLGDLLSGAPVHHIPVFQRRYCWNELQWKDLWRDMLTMRMSDGVEGHSMGRVLMQQRPDGSRLILDGQQRFTTINILLSALCDRLNILGAAAEAQSVESLYGVGKLIPTLDDRSDFCRCMTEHSPEGAGLLLEAKRVYANLCEPLTVEECVDLIRTVRERFAFKSFVLASAERLQVVFQKIATGHWETEGSSPGISMSPVDFIRNFVLEHFNSEVVMREMHSKYWSPIESSVGTPEQMESLFEQFLSRQNFPTYRDALYDDFEAWWRSGLQHQQAEPAEYAAKKLQEVAEFARNLSQ